MVVFRNEAGLSNLARSFICDQIEFEICKELPEGLYGFDQDEDVLFRIIDRCNIFIGGSGYIAVSKKTGAVHYHGALGE